jgi:hypothetical protein
MIHSEHSWPDARARAHAHCIAAGGAKVAATKPRGETPHRSPTMTTDPSIDPCAWPANSLTQRTRKSNLRQVAGGTISLTTNPPGSRFIYVSQFPRCSARVGYSADDAAYRVIGQSGTMPALAGGLGVRGRQGLAGLRGVKWRVLCVRNNPRHVVFMVCACIPHHGGLHL